MTPAKRLLGSAPFLFVSAILCGFTTSVRGDEVLLWSGEVEGYQEFVGDPVWLPTIRLLEASTYHIRASGSVRINLAGDVRDCRGCRIPPAPDSCSGVPQAGTWAAPGTRAFGLSGRLPGCWQPVRSLGCDTTFSAGCTVMLELIFNDFRDEGGWCYWDNSGHFDVEIYRTQASGACCYSSGICGMVTSGDCARRDGTYLGDGVLCSPERCPLPPGGACCKHDGHCLYVLIGDCSAVGGIYSGDGVACAPNPCPPPVEPEDRISWGRLKAVYR